MLPQATLSATNLLDEDFSDYENGWGISKGSDANTNSEIGGKSIKIGAESPVSLDVTALEDLIGSLFP